VRVVQQHVLAGPAEIAVRSMPPVALGPTHHGG
jgi:hypothetical protein